MKNLLFALIILLVGCGQEQNKADLIIGTWEFQKTHDLRTTDEKKESDIIPTLSSSFDENPVMTFIAGGKYQEEHNNGIVENGLWEINNDSLIISIKANFADKREALNNPVIKANIRFEKNGIYFLYGGDFSIKSLNKRDLQLGNDKLFRSYLRRK